MFRKRQYSESEQRGRMRLFRSELLQQCKDINTLEFEYSFDIWGVWWMPWFIYAEGKLLSFTANDIDEDDLKKLVDDGRIQIVKVYEGEELNGELTRIRYRIVQSLIET